MVVHLGFEMGETPGGRGLGNFDQVGFSSGKIKLKYASVLVFILIACVSQGCSHLGALLDW